MPDNTRPSIGVIGAGWLGGTVGRALALAGYPVTFSSRHPERLRGLTKGAPASRTGSVDEAMACDVILLATPHDAVTGYGTAYADAVLGKVVIDATNPGGGTPAGKQGDRLGVGILNQELFPTARLVRCFCAVDATCVEDGHGYGDTEPLGVPVAGDSAEAVALAEELVRATGCEPVTTGQLDTARMFQRGSPGFRANTNAGALKALMGLTQDA